MKYKHQENYKILEDSINRRLDKLNFSRLKSVGYLHSKLHVIISQLSISEQKLIIGLFLCYYDAKNKYFKIRKNKILNITDQKIISPYRLRAKDILVSVRKDSLTIADASGTFGKSIKIVRK